MQLLYGHWKDSSSLFMRLNIWLGCETVKVFSPSPPTPTPNTSDPEVCNTGREGPGYVDQYITVTIGVETRLTLQQNTNLGCESQSRELLFHLLMTFLQGWKARYSCDGPPRMGERLGVYQAYPSCCIPAHLSWCEGRAVVKAMIHTFNLRPQATDSRSV